MQSRIDSLKKFSTREKLAEFVDKNRDTISITGGTLIESGESFDGLVRDIPYGYTMAVKHKGTLYCIAKGTDGKLRVVNAHGHDM